MNTGSEQALQHGEETIYINNPGIIIVWPFLPAYFERLGLMHTGAFNGVQEQVRAACLLQFLVTGREEMTNEQLVLNKLLCGIPHETRIDVPVNISTDERNLSDEMLQAVIKNWTVMKNTSITALRETFFQRQGKLVYAENRNQLSVERKTIDVLLDQVPWSISIIKLPWMERVLHVDWR